MQAHVEHSKQNIEKELYFLIAKFLAAGPCQESAKLLQEEMEKLQLIPKRVDWCGAKHPCSFAQLDRNLRLHIAPDHLLKLCLRLPPLVDKEVPSNIAGLNTLLGCGRQSALRRKEDAFKAPQSCQSLIARRHGMPLLPSHHTNSHYPGNICNILLAREKSGLAPSLQNSFPTSFFAKKQRHCRLLGHLSSVYCVLFDRTSRYIFTGADDNLVKIWSSKDGRLLACLRGHSGEISDLAVNYENTILASASCDKMIRVWCLRTLAPIAILVSHTGMVTSIRFCPYPEGDPRYLISTGNDGTVCFWSYSPKTNTFNPKPLKFMERTRPGAQMVCSSFSAGGVFLATGSTDHHIRVYHILKSNGPEKILDVETHTDRVDSLSFSNRGSRFISGSKDGTALIWKYEHHQWTNIVLKMTTKLVNGHPVQGTEESKLKLRVNMVFWNTDDSIVATSVSNHAIKIWNSYTGTLLFVLNSHDDEVYCLETHPFDSRILLSGGHDGRICIWDLTTGTPIKNYFNMIEGQGHGAVFDCKWSPDGLMFVSTDSYGHLSIYGFGSSENYKKVPEEQFFHTDYRPLIRDANNHVLDEQTQCAPHLMPPPFLVDIDGNPYPPHIQRLVPGRENCSDAQLVPYVVSSEGGAEVLQPVRAADRTTIDDMIERLQQEQAGQQPSSHRTGHHHGGSRARREGDVEGVRQSTGFWQTRGEGACSLRRSAAPVVKSLPPALVRLGEEQRLAHAHQEIQHYLRESGRSLPRKNDQNLSSIRKEERSLRRRTLHEKRMKTQEAKAVANDDAADANSDSSTSSSNSAEDDESLSSDSDYSDWMTERLIRPRPSRNRRRQAPNITEEPSSIQKDEHQRTRSSRKAQNHHNTSNDLAVPSTSSGPTQSTSQPSTSGVNPNFAGVPGGLKEVPEHLRPPNWMTALMPQKAPYVPQLGDEVVYFRQGHQLYVQAVRKAKVYDIPLRTLPWKKIPLREHEVARIVDLRYELLPPRLCCVTLMLLNPCDEDLDTFTLRFHDMPDVLDFMVLKQTYDHAIDRNWAPGDRFRSVIDDAWWLGTIESREPLQPEFPDSVFQCFTVTWDNGETERMSPWDFEPVNEERLPREIGGSVDLSPEEREMLMYVPKNSEWSVYGQKADSRRIALGLEKIMQLSIAEPFTVPVDLNVYPGYAFVVEYPMDLSTIKSRLENRYYRRLEALKFDVRFIEENALKFNEPNSTIVQKAKQVNDLVLSFIGRVDCDDPMLLYQSRQVSDGEDTEVSFTRSDMEENGEVRPSALTRRRGSGGDPGEYTSESWKKQCMDLLAHLCRSEDSTPFRRPVDMQVYPNYREIIDTPMDLGTIRCKLESDIYQSPVQFCKDVRLVFQNSKSYNTNKKSRIYRMTLRLSTMFEELIRSIVSDWRSAVVYEEKLRNNQYVSDRRKPRADLYAAVHELDQPSTSGLIRSLGKQNGSSKVSKKRHHSSESDDSLDERIAKKTRLSSREKYNDYKSQDPRKREKLSSRTNMRLSSSHKRMLNKRGLNHLDQHSESGSSTPLIRVRKARRRPVSHLDDDDVPLVPRIRPVRRQPQPPSEDDEETRDALPLSRLRRSRQPHSEDDEAPSHRPTSKLRSRHHPVPSDDEASTHHMVTRPRRLKSHHSEDESFPRYTGKKLRQRPWKQLVNQSDDDEVVSSHHMVTRLRQPQRQTQCLDEDEGPSSHQVSPSKMPRQQRRQQINHGLDEEEVLGCSKDDASLSHRETTKTPRPRRQQISHGVAVEDVLPKFSKVSKLHHPNEERTSAHLTTSKGQQSRRRQIASHLDEDDESTLSNHSRLPKHQQTNQRSLHQSDDEEPASHPYPTRSHRIRHPSEEREPEISTRSSRHSQRPTQHYEEENTSAKRKAFLRSRNKLRTRAYDMPTTETESENEVKSHSNTRSGKTNNKTRSLPKRKGKIKDYAISDNSEGETCSQPTNRHNRSHTKKDETNGQNDEQPGTSGKKHYTFRKDKQFGPSHQSNYKFRKFKLEVESEVEDEINPPSSRHHYHFRSKRFLQKTQEINSEEEVETKSPPRESRKTPQSTSYMPRKSNNYETRSSKQHLEKDIKNEHFPNLRKRKEHSPSRLRPFLSRSSKQHEDHFDENSTSSGSEMDLSDYKQAHATNASSEIVLEPKRRPRGRPRLVPRPPPEVGTSSNDSNQTANLETTQTISCKLLRKDVLKFKGRIQTRNGGQRTVHYQEDHSDLFDSTSSDSDSKQYISVSSRGRLRKLNRHAQKAMMYHC